MLFSFLEFSSSSSSSSSSSPLPFFSSLNKNAQQKWTRSTRSSPPPLLLLLLLLPGSPMRSPSATPKTIVSVVTTTMKGERKEGRDRESKRANVAVVVVVVVVVGFSQTQNLFFKKNFLSLESFDANPPSSQFDDHEDEDDAFVATAEDVAAWEAGLAPPPRPRHRELRYASSAAAGDDEKTAAGGGETRYSGETLGGLRHGWGRLECSNGDAYVGSWKLGLRHGKGKAVFPSRRKKKEEEGDSNFEDVSYDGDWRDDKADGYGSFFSLSFSLSPSLSNALTSSLYSLRHSTGKAARPTKTAESTSGSSPPVSAAAGAGTPSLLQNLLLPLLLRPTRANGKTTPHTARESTPALSMAPSLGPGSEGAGEKGAGPLRTERKNTRGTGQSSPSPSNPKAHPLRLLPSPILSPPP